MKPDEIRVELKKIKKTLNQAQIARALNPPVTQVAIMRVINKEFVSIRIMQAVADAIGRDKKYVFPEYFIKKTHNAHEKQEEI